jgi:hypothetical protein
MEVNKNDVWTRKDVAEYWNIPHIISVDNIEAWKIAFNTLYYATIALDTHQELMISIREDNNQLAKQLEDLEVECEMYFNALEKISEKYDIDISEYLNK